MASQGGDDVLCDLLAWAAAQDGGAAAVLPLCAVDIDGNDALNLATRFGRFRLIIYDLLIWPAS